MRGLILLPIQILIRYECLIKQTRAKCLIDTFQKPFEFTIIRIPCLEASVCALYSFRTLGIYHYLTNLSNAKYKIWILYFVHNSENHSNPSTNINDKTLFTTFFFLVKITYKISKLKIKWFSPSFIYSTSAVLKYTTIYLHRNYCRYKEHNDTVG